MEQTGLDSFTGAIEWRWRTKNQHRSRKVYPFRLSIGQRQYKRYSGDTTKWVRPNFVRLTPYTPYTTWHEDPVNDPIFLKRKDSLTISWKLNIKLIPGLRNGYVILPAGMDQTVTPSNNPLIGGLDADKFLYESLTKRGRAIRRNRNRAKGWKIYQSYVPTRQDSILFPRISKVSEQDSLPKQDTLLIKKDSAIINQNSLLLKDKINGKDQTEKSR